jgi:hypothetical protein
MRSTTTILMHYVTTGRDRRRFWYDVTTRLNASAQPSPRRSAAN